MVKKNKKSLLCWRAVGQMIGKYGKRAPHFGFHTFSVTYLESNATFMLDKNVYYLDRFQLSEHYYFHTACEK